MEFESFSSSPDPEWMHSSSPDPERMHDVFINFRGEDTRMNFVSHLHAALSNAGVNTFLDEANFPKGVELKQGLLRTIERSRICLVVFSRNYTESSWCLEELENIIECHQTYGHIVLPIFYLVTPSQVRHQTGDFGNTLKAFARQRLWGKSVMLRWKNVLTAATNFSGWDVTDNRNQAQLVKEIVEVVIKKLDNTSMSVTEFPVGLESRMQEVIGFIANKSSTVCIIGIWGMGGLGKTTTAKVIFNQIHHRGYVTEILNGCGLHADIGIAVLIERSLIKVEKSNKLGIHDLLRDMGREIIRESSTKTPGKRSRLWFHDDVVEVLTKNTGTEAIEGLTLKIQLTSTGCFNTSAFKKMQGLRLLHLDHVKLSEDYGYLPKQLRWIYWKRFPLKYIPNNFCMQRVIAIDLKYSNLRQVWKEPQVFPWLKILNLSHSKFLIETPDFSKLPSLEKLILKDCPSLCKVDQSIGDLCNLQLINLEDCTSLSSLPIETYKLKSLKTLILSGCSKIEKLEEDIGQMESLTSLIAKNTAVKQVPFSIVRSKSVGYISLCGFEGLSRNVFPSIILSWMSPTMNPLSHIHSFSGTSASIVSMDTQNNALGDPAPVLSNLSNLRSVLVQCDTEFQLSTQLGAVLDGVYDVNISGLEITSEASQTSKHSLNSYMIGIGSYEEVFNTLSKIISEGLTASESCDVLLPSDNYPSWLAKTGEGHSVSFIMPEDCRIKGMALCVVYCSNPENTMTESLVSVLLVNNTKSTIHIYKHETLISFKDEDWEGLMSHLGSGDTVEIFVTFGDGLVAKKTALYLICDESIEKEMVPSRKRKKEAENNAFVRFVRKISRGIRTFVFSFFSLPHSKKKPCI
ncbi:unnamed protein product [Sphenostylis stenocarpa]|uniref:TIR domain-containing protein n=1 Tax=Sphenostylis stenocarpa TaxID=92480 RepID=A0AA86SAL8_9FABA|nr:unnamed protein product [Sphenostylis stenocarpa]